MLNAILCALFGHRVPPEPGVIQLLSGNYICARCTQHVWRDHHGHDVCPSPFVCEKCEVNDGTVSSQNNGPWLCRKCATA